MQAAVDVEHATRLLDVDTDRVGAYGPFALYRRCRNASAVLPPEDGYRHRGSWRSTISIFG